MRSKPLQIACVHALAMAVFGCLFPIVATLIDISSRGETLSLAAAWQAHMIQPLLWIINLAPFVLGLLAFLLSRRQSKREGVAQEAHSISTARLETTIRQMTDAIIVEDAERRLMIANAAFCEMFAIPAAPEALVGTDCAEAAEASAQLFLNSEGFAAGIQSILDGRSPVLGEALALKDGRTLERDYVPLFMGDSYCGNLWCYRDITESQRAIHDLRDKTGFLSTLIDHLPVMLAIFDEDRRVTRINETLIQSLGWSLSDWQDTDFFSRCFPTGDEQAAATELFHGSSSGWGTFRTATRGGQLLRIRWFNVRLSSGETVSIGQDQTESERVRSELQGVVENLPETIFVKDARSLRYCRINTAAETLLGKTRDMFLNKTDYDIFPKHVADGFVREDRAVIASGKLHEVEESIDTPHGRRLLITKKMPLLGSDGIAEYLLGISRDVTEEKEIEKALLGRRIFFELSLDPLCVAGFDGYFKELSPAWESMLGFSTAELMAEPFMNFVHPDDVSATLRETEALAKRDRVTLGFSNRYRTKSGEYRWLEWNAAADADTDGIFAIARDVTEQRQRAAELVRAKEEALDASLAKSQFLANMSHEIRTPMNGVVGMTDVLLGTSLNGEQRDYVDTIKASAFSLRELIDDILDFSKIEAGKLQVEHIAFDLRGTLHSIVSLFQQNASSKGIGLRFIMADDTPEAVLGDPYRLRQVLTNLISNAVKFTSHGEVVLRVRPERTRGPKSELLRFEVVDTGIGLRADLQERVFRPFTQADGSTTRTFGGTGLGLAICKQLVELMGGHIGVESQVGAGSVFWFNILLPPDREGLLQTGIESDKPRKTQVKRHIARILVAEDNTINQKVVRAMLTQLGYEAQVVNHGRSAVEAHLRDRYDLILMDCQMPEMDGFDATARIRQADAHADVPIVAMTAQVMKEDRDRCLSAGMDDFVAKPITKEVLLPMIKKHLAAKGQAARRRSLTESKRISGAPSAIDTKVLDKLREQTFDGRTDLVPELIKAFLREVPDQCETLRQCAHDGDAAGVIREAHRLRSSAGNLGAIRMGELCATLEHMGRSGDTSDSLRTAEELLAELERARAELEAYEQGSHTRHFTPTPSDSIHPAAPAPLSITPPPK